MTEWFALSVLTNIIAPESGVKLLVEQASLIVELLQASLTALQEKKGGLPV